MSETGGTPRRITILPGDGIGAEVVEVGERVLREVAGLFSLSIRVEGGEIGQSAVERFGNPLPDDTLQKVMQSHAVLLGAVGGLQADKKDYAIRPEAGLLSLRKNMGLYANLRPVKIPAPLVHASPLKREVVEGTDLLVVRELIGGLYFGEPRGREMGEGKEEAALNTMVYTTSQIERVAHRAFALARERRKRLVSVDKANVLEVSLLWRDVVNRVHEDYPDVTLTHQYVDNCAMQLIRDPGQFDVILTENLFGDILSDEAAVLAGSIGMLPSASLGMRGALYEPVHGSAPDIVGQNKANPLATILSVALMFRYSFDLPEAGECIESAVLKTLEDGYRTPDIGSQTTEQIGTKEMGERVLERIVAPPGVGGR